MDNRNTSGEAGERAGSTGSSAGGEKLRGAMDDAKRSADQVASEVKDAAADLAGQARAAAAEAADRTTRRVTDYAEQQKGVAAEQIVKLSEAAHAAADHLTEGSPTMARYAHDLAGGIDRFAGAVRERSVGDMVRQAADYARREPAVFVAGTVFAGFLMARFLRSSAERAERHQWEGRGMGASRDRNGNRYADRSGFGPDAGRSASTGPAAMPGQAGSGRSYDPSRRYDERDSTPAGSRSGMTGQGATASRSATGGSPNPASSYKSPSTGPSTWPDQTTGGRNGR